MVKTDKLYLTTQVGFLAAMLAILQLGLLPGLLSGLFVYYIVVFGAAQMARIGVLPSTGRVILLIVLTAALVLGLAAGIGALATQFSAGSDGVFALMQKMADVVATARSHLPGWMQEWLPANMAEMQAASSDWLRKNASSIGLIGKDALVVFAHIFIGMIIGGMVALNPSFPAARGELAKAVGERVSFLGTAFRRVVFSQIRISALNTLLTGLFLVLVLPMLDAALPFTKTMIVVTFVVGLLPIVGNLISNTIIFLIGLSVSPFAATGTLLYLIFIHKLEYFVNARIIGSQIRARAWEILLAMLVMESIFGLVGLIAAPIYYAYVKDELSSQDLI